MVVLWQDEAKAHTREGAVNSSFMRANHNSPNSDKSAHQSNLGDTGFSLIAPKENGKRQQKVRLIAVL